MNYYINNELENLRKDLEKAICEKAAWEKVCIVTKKDGTPFKNLTQNFTNCSFNVDSWNTAPFEKTMSVYFHSEKLGYLSAKMDCFKALAKDEIAPNEENVYTRSFGGRGYVYTVDEMVDSIECRVNYLSDRIEQLKDAINRADEMSDYIESIQETLQEFNKDNKQIYYALTNALHRIY